MMYKLIAYSLIKDTLPVKRKNASDSPDHNPKRLIDLVAYAEQALCELANLVSHRPLNPLDSSVHKPSDLASEANAYIILKKGYYGWLPNDGSRFKDLKPEENIFVSMNKLGDINSFTTLKGITTFLSFQQYPFGTLYESKNAKATETYKEYFEACLSKLNKLDKELEKLKIHCEKIQTTGTLSKKIFFFFMVMHEFLNAARVNKK